MASISLNDQLGVSVDAQLPPSSALLKYVQQIPKLRFGSVRRSETIRAVS
jgi:hypothetical protein